MTGFGKWGVRILGTAAALLGLFLLVGFLLSGRWEANASLEIRASPERIFALVDAPVAWRSWTPWPDSGLVSQGPASGVGARVTWDDPELGDGAFEIVEARAPSLVRYKVAVQHGSMRTEGTIQMEPSPLGTRVTWTERGDFGRNPLMGYWALAMKRAQGRELSKDLVHLAKLAGDSTVVADSAP